MNPNIINILLIMTFGTICLMAIISACIATAYSCKRKAMIWLARTSVSDLSKLSTAVLEAMTKTLKEAQDKKNGVKKDVAVPKKEDEDTTEI